jgi:Putative adhesin
VTAVRTERTVALAVGGLLALLFGALASLHVAGWTLGSATRTQHRVIRGASGVNVFADGRADVVVEAALGPDATVDAVSRATLRRPRLRLSVGRGGDVHVAGGCGPVIFGSCRATVTVRVPLGDPVTVHSGAGDVQLSGLSGPVNVDAGAGDITATDLTGTANLHSGSGDIDAHHLTGPMTLASDSGDVAGDNLWSARARGSSGSGDIDLVFSAPPKHADAETGSGDVSLLVPRGVAYAVDAVTSAGDRDVGVAQRATSAHALRVRTGSGDVAVENGA